MTAIWYYDTQKLEAGAPSLNGLTDNNGGPKTPNFWMDDSLAYRFVSVVQNDPTAVLQTYNFFKTCGTTRTTG